MYPRGHFVFRMFIVVLFLIAKGWKQIYQQNKEWRKQGHPYDVLL